MGAVGRAAYGSPDDRSAEPSRPDRSFAMRVAFVFTGRAEEMPLFGADLPHAPRLHETLRLDGHPLTQGRLWRVTGVEWRLETSRRGDRPEAQIPPDHLPAAVVTLAEEPRDPAA